MININKKLMEMLRIKSLAILLLSVKGIDLQIAPFQIAIEPIKGTGLDGLPLVSIYINSLKQNK